MNFLRKSLRAELLMTIPLIFSSVASSNAVGAPGANDRYKISLCKFNSTITSGGASTYPVDASATSDSAEFAKNALANFEKSLSNLKYPGEEAVSEAPGDNTSPTFNAAATQGALLWNFLKVYLQKLNVQFTSGSLSAILGPEELCSYLNHSKIKKDQIEQERLFAKGDPNASPLNIDFLLKIPSQSNREVSRPLSLGTPESSKAAVLEIMKSSDLVSAIVNATIDREFVILNGDIAVRLPMNLAVDLGAQSQAIIGGKGLLNKLFVSKKPHSSNTNRFVLIKLIGFKVPRIPPSQWNASFFAELNNQRPSIEIFFGDHLRFLQMGTMAKLNIQSFDTRIAKRSDVGTKVVVADKLTIKDKKFWTTPIDETWHDSGADNSRLDGVINLGGKWTNLGDSIESLANTMLPLILNIDHLIINFVPQQITTSPLTQLGREAKINILVPNIVNPSLQTQGLTGLYFQLPKYLSIGAADFFISLFGTPYHVFRADEYSPLHIPIPKEATLSSIEANNKKLRFQAGQGIDMLYTIIDKNISAAIETNLDCSSKSTDEEWEQCLDLQAKKIGFNPNLD